MNNILTLKNLRRSSLKGSNTTDFIYIYIYIHISRGDRNKQENKIQYQHITEMTITETITDLTMGIVIITET